MDKNPADSLTHNKYRIYLLVIFFVLYGVFFVYTSREYWKEDSIDFPSYYYAAQASFGKGISPYGFFNLDEVAPDNGNSDRSVLPFLYPPPSLILFSPFTLLDYESARRLMLIINILLILPLTYGIIKISGERLGGWVSVVFLLYIIFFRPLIVTIDYGQINIVATTFLCWAWYFLKRNKTTYAALFLSLSVILKLYPILLIIPLWFRRKYKTVFLTMAMLGFLALISWLILPNETWSNWYTRIGSIGFGQYVLGMPTTIPSNQSVYGFLARIFYGHNLRFEPLLYWSTQVTELVPYIASCLLLLTTMVASFISRKSDSLDIDISLWLAAIYIAAPISWYHHMVFVLPAIPIVLYYLVFKHRDIKILVPTGAIALFWLYNFPVNSPAFRYSLRILLISTPFYFMISLWIILVYILLKARQSKTRQTSAITDQ